MAKPVIEQIALNNIPKIEKINFKEKDFIWVNINDPTEQETAYLKRNYKFHDLDLEDCLSESQRPKIDEYEDYLFLVLHIPVKSRGGHVKNTEINMFIGQHYIITLHEQNHIINKIFEKCKKKKTEKEEYMGKGSGYFLYILTRELFDSCFPLIDDITKEINELELEVFDNYSKDRLHDILMAKKDIINFRRIIMPQRNIIAQLEHKNKKFLPENLDVYFDDIVDKIEKMWNSLENLQELIVSLQDTNESVISHNTNNIIKILTVFSVILLPLNLITGFYGMNVVGLPFATHEMATEIVFGGIVFVGLILILYFRHKKWL